VGYSFDGPTKVITLTVGTVEVSVRDLWSRWVDWLLTGDNSKYLIAMSEIGGDDIDPGAGTTIPVYVFLQNGWRIKPDEDDHTLNVTDGILLVSGGGDPFIDTTGDFVVRINYQQPVQAISFSSEGGGGATPAEVWAYGTRTLTDDWPTAEQIADAIAGRVVDELTLAETMKALLAHAAGKASGGGTNTLKFRDQGDTKDVITVTVDENGNRSAVVVDAD
jgi:hypothetical protein